MSKSLVLGGRGSGKSAIFRSLTDAPVNEGDTANVITVPLEAQQSTWKTLDQAVKASNNDLLLLSRQWEFALLLLAFNALVESNRDVRRRKLIRDVDAEVKRELAQAELQSQSMLSDAFDAAASILRKLPFTVTVAAPLVSLQLTSEGSSSEQPTGRELDKRQDLLVKGMYAVLQTLVQKGVRVHILADKLDDFWTASKSQIDSLVALVTAVMEMKDQLNRRRMDDAIGCSLFLRSDIYDTLKENGLNNASKYRRDELQLKWDVPVLRRMVERRMEVAGIDGASNMDSLFTDEKLDRHRLVDYFFSRVVPRPRDVINFLALCAEEAGYDDAISASCMSLAEASYSSWRKTVILEEARYGVLKGPVDLVNSFSSGPRTYSAKELRRHLDESKRENSILSDSKPRYTEALFDWGVLGVQGLAPDVQYVWNVHEGQRPKRATRLIRARRSCGSFIPHCGQPLPCRRRKEVNLSEETRHPKRE